MEYLKNIWLYFKIIISHFEKCTIANVGNPQFKFIILTYLLLILIF